MDFGQAFFLYIASIKVLDALTVFVIWFWAWSLRFQSQLIPVSKGVPEFAEYMRVALPLVLSFSTAFHLIGTYRKDRIAFGFRPVKKIVQGSILGTLVFVSVLYFTETVHISRIYITLFTALSIVALIFERFVLHSLWSLVQKSVIQPIRILLIGHGDLLKMYVMKIRHREPYPVLWTGILGESPTSIENIPYLGTEKDLPRVLEQRKVDLAVVSYPTEESHRYATILEPLSNELVSVKVLPDFGRYSTFTYSADQECGIPLLLFNNPPVGATDRFLKRAVDILGALFFLFVFSPVFLLIALVVKLTSKGPIFYSQTRLGADDRLFEMYKFRSMKINAEEKSGAVWAKENDPRVTWIGKWIRRTSLDEIPQFYNVLIGDMSLVGPRPERPVFVGVFKRDVPKYMLRHKMKSGITGWAQINGWRGNTSIEERVKHDLYYIEHWSHYFDIKILVLTLFKGFVNRHAY